MCIMYLSIYNYCKKKTVLYNFLLLKLNDKDVHIIIIILISKIIINYF